jgi:predicted transcriptional regulator
MPEDSRDMNEALRKARESVGLKQTQLEELAALSAGTIHDLESGRRSMPGFDAGSRILTVLKRRGIRRSELDRIFPVEVGK